MKQSVGTVAALLVTSALSSPAFSQVYSPPGVPPIRQTIDQNGVDVTSGTIIAGSHSVSIGPAGAAGMSWSRWMTGGTAYYDSTAIVITVSGSTYTVSNGGSSESFTLTGGDYVPGQGTGSTLALSGPNFIYTTRDGTVYTFAPAASVSYHQYQGSYRVSSITYPTGEIRTFNWETVDGICVWNEKYMFCERFNGERLRSVTSTNGYKLVFTFQVENPSSVNHATPGWAAIATVAAQNMSVDPASQSWPTLTFTGQTFFTPTVTVADSLNRTTTYIYTADGSGYYPTLLKVQRPGASSPNKIITWNTSGLVGAVTNNGVADSYTYSVLGNVLTTTVVDPNSHTRVVKTDTTTGLVSSDTDELNKTTSYTYDPSTGLLKTVTAPELNYVTYYYDGRGNVVQTTSTPKPGSGLSPLTTAADYPASDGTRPWMCPAGTPAVTCNKPTRATDAKGQTTNYSWSTTSGLPLTVTPPVPSSGAAQPQTRYSYTSVYGEYWNGSSLASFSTPVTRLNTISQCQTQDFTSNPCAGTSDEVKTTVGYALTGVTNANALPLTVSKGAGDGSLTATNTYSWDLIGNQTLLDGPINDDVTSRYYDADRELIGIAGPGTYTAKNRATRISYNSDGQVTKVEAGTVPNETAAGFASLTSFYEADTGYDSNARATTQKLVSGSTTYALTQTTYDNMGRVDCSTVRMNSAIYSALPTSACTAGSAGSFGPDRITKMGYDWDSRPLSATIAYALSDQASTTLTYNDNGQVTSLKDGENNKTTYIYDGFDRVYQTQYPNATKGSGTSNPADYEQFSYDGNSNVATYRTRSGANITYGYDNLNRQSYMTSSLLSDRSYSYDLLNRPHTATFTSSGQGVTNNYDALSRLTSSSSNMGGTAHALSYQYDLSSRRTRTTWWDGFYVDYVRLVTGEIYTVTAHPNSSTSTLLATFGYDDLGNRTSATWANNTATSYSFDAVSRLTSLTHSFVSNPSNNVTISFGDPGGSPVPPYNPASQITKETVSNDDYVYAPAASAKSYTSNGLNQYLTAGLANPTYDSNGNLDWDGTRNHAYDIENKLASTLNGGPGTALNYDPLNRLDTYNNGTTTRFIYDGDEVAVQLDSSGNILRREIRGDGPDEVLVEYNPTDYRFYYADERGSTIATADPNGNRTSVDTYDEFGNPSNNSSPPLFKFTGQMWLPDAGVYSYKARDYSPSLGTFMQTDPAGYADSPNLYAYVLNDPVNLSDPSGLFHTIQYCFNPGGPAGEGPNGSIDILGRVCINITVWDQSDIDSLFRRVFSLPTFEGGGAGPVYLTKIDCSGWKGRTVRASGEGAIAFGGAGVALGGTGVAVGTGLGIFGAVTGDVPAAGLGAIVAAASAPIAAGGAVWQAGGATVAFIGGRSSRELVKNATGAVINALPLPKWVKAPLNQGAKYLSKYTPDIRTCRAGP